MQGDGTITRDQALEMVKAAMDQHMKDHHPHDGVHMYYYQCRKCGDKVKSEIQLMHGCYAKTDTSTSRYCGGRYEEINKKDYYG